MIYGDVIGRWGRAFPDAEALVDAITNKRYTYGALNRESRRMARFLQKELGIAKRDRVACLSFNRAGIHIPFSGVEPFGRHPGSFEFSSGQR